MSSQSVGKQRSPRSRFWLVTFVTPAAVLSAASIGPSRSVLGLFLLLIWLTGMLWVLAAHAHQVGGWTKLSARRTIVVSVGLTIAMLLSCAILITYFAFRHVDS